MSIPAESTPFRAFSFFLVYGGDSSWRYLRWPRQQPHTVKRPDNRRDTPFDQREGQLRESERERRASVGKPLCCGGSSPGAYLRGQRGGCPPHNQDCHPPANRSLQGWAPAGSECRTCRAGISKCKSDLSHFRHSQTSSLHSQTCRRVFHSRSSPVRRATVLVEGSPTERTR